MSNIVLSKTGDNVFRIAGLGILTSRQMMRFNIFLNALKSVDIKREPLTTEISFINEEHAAKCLCEIVTHLEKLVDKVEMDQSTAMLVDKMVKHQTEGAATLEQLKKVNTDSNYMQDQYADFCSFCDNHLRITLRPYQYKSAYLLSTGKGGFDFSVPGAGKTIITYATYCFLKENDVVDSVFVVGPGSSYNAWYDEYNTCFGSYPDFENLAEASTKDCKLYLEASSKNHKEISFINTEKIRLVEKEIIEFMKKHKALLIIDEAHKIKSPEAKTTISAMKCAKFANSRILLTGTPMPNGYEDLFSLTKTFSPYYDILPYNYAQLKSMTKNGATKSQATRIRECVSPYYSRISKKYLLETKELLPPTFEIVECDMDEEQSTLYHRLDDFFGKIKEDIDEDILMSLKKAVLIRKMQISANPALLANSLISSMDELRDEYDQSINKSSSDIDSLIVADKRLTSCFAASSIARTVSRYEGLGLSTAKNRKAVELALQLIEQGEKVLIWDIFVKNMMVLKKMLESELGSGVEMINGSISGVDRQNAIKRFREGNSVVLVANPATLAESISLHRVCQHAIYVNRNFNAAQFIQSKDRIHRINMPQGTTAHYYFLVNKGSVDLCVDERLNKKEMRMLSILDAEDIVVGGAEMDDTKMMSNEDIESSFAR